MPAIIIKDSGVAHILSNLLSRDVQAVSCQGLQPHAATYRGLVSDENHLLSVVACDLEFAHRSAAALAMIPAGAVEHKVTVPDHDLMEFYDEVANVLRHALHEAEGFFQDVSHDVRDWNAKIVGDSPDVFRERFRNPRVQHPLFPPVMPAAAPTLTSASIPFIVSARLRSLGAVCLRRLAGRRVRAGVARLFCGVGTF